MRMTMKIAFSAVLAALLLSGAPAMQADDSDDLQSRRAGIDAMAKETMERLFKENPSTQELFDASMGYAVFDNLKFAFVISGGGGVGVAVTKGSGQKIYMKMGTGGIGLAVGGQSYQVVFLFQDSATFERFVDNGWQAEAAAAAAAGTSGKNVPTTFTNGLAVYQLTHKGLIAQADISGTKYWKSKKLN